MLALGRKFNPSDAIDFARENPEMTTGTTLECSTNQDALSIELSPPRRATEPNTTLHRGARFGTKPISFEFDLGVGEDRDSSSVKLAWSCEKPIDRNHLAHLTRTVAPSEGEQGDGGEKPSDGPHAV